MKTYRVIFLVLLFSSCSVLQKTVEVDLFPMAVESFLQSPFGYSETIDGFKKEMPEGTRIQKLIKRNPQAQHKPDTIYNFLFKKSKISIYKTQFSQEFLLGGNVRNNQIGLVNGIRKGMTKAQFYQSFTNLEFSQQDSVTLKEPGINRTVSFYFNRKGKLERFTFTGKN
ncbi:MAG: hypothetical protein PHE03_11480 [Bacteroidales bacterium]|nr:hypothetical protein [Bacteroidales bacterium]MDD3892909.1 hypothetical protein [Bacteroidales bacterium]